MSILKLLIVTLLLSQIWFDYLQLGQWFKVKTGHKPHEYMKPWDCYTCTNFWLGSFVGLVYFTGVLILNFSWLTFVDLFLFLGLNYLAGNLIDYIKYEERT